jgi:hypothetical protein
MRCYVEAANEVQAKRLLTEALDLIGTWAAKSRP